MKKIVFSLVLTLFAAFMNAQESQTSYNFLRLPVSAHAAALGGDNITLIEDDEALVFHNPALLSSVSDKTINLNYMNYMSGVNVASASFNRIVKEKASWAVSAQYIDYGKMKQTDENNIEMGDSRQRTLRLRAISPICLPRISQVVSLPDSSPPISVITTPSPWA